MMRLTLRLLIRMSSTAARSALTVFILSLGLSVIGHAEEAEDAQKMMTAFSALQHHLRTMPGPPAMLHSQHGRGIVTAAGSVDQLVNLYIVLRVLREVCGSTLPVEIAHVAADKPDDSLIDKIQADVPGVRIVDLDTRPQPEHHQPFLLSGYAIKVYAIYSSAFQEVVFLDADCMPLRDPEILFNTHEYRHHGTTFFPDFQHQMHVGDFMYSAFSLPHPNHDPAYYEAESGQLVIDRRRHWESLEYVWMLVTHSDILFAGNKAWGDKDLFRLAFALSGNSDSYYQVPGGPVAGLQGPGDQTMTEQSREHYVLAAAVQEIPAGHAMFFHRMSASAKFNLESPSYLHTTHMTARPLKSVEYAPIMVTDPLFDNRRTQWSARWPAEAFDATVAQRCAPHSTAMACMQHLHISRPAQWAKIQQEGTSVPVLPVSFWVNIEHAINFSYAMFEHIRSHQNVSSQPTVPPRHHLRFSARWNIGL